MLSLLLAASTTLLSLDDGHVNLAVPFRARVVRHRGNWETDTYEVYAANEKEPFLWLSVGGGSYDFHGYARICLNGRKAWRSESVDSGIVVVGYPGSNSVSANWSKLSGQHLSEAKDIAPSLQIDWGPKC